MANRRIRKKRARKTETSLIEEAGSTESLYAPREIVVTVPCPACRRAFLDRTYIPAFGTMSGTVSCPGCRYEDLYLNALGQVMSSTDPLPENFASARTTTEISKERERTRASVGGHEESPSPTILWRLIGLLTGLRRLPSMALSEPHPRHRFAA